MTRIPARRMMGAARASSSFSQWIWRNQPISCSRASSREVAGWSNCDMPKVLRLKRTPTTPQIGERSQLTVGDVGLHQGDALETSGRGGKAVEQAAIVGAVRLGADQEPMRQAVRVEHGQEPRHAARLARMRLVGRIRRIRKAGAAEHVGVAVGSAQSLHASPPQERSVRRLSRNPDRRSRISGAPMPRIALSVAASMPCW